MEKASVLNDSSLINFLQELLDGFKIYPKGYAVARCPFHDDHNPSLFVDPKTGRFHCKACGEVGGLVKLTAQAKGLALKEAKGLLERMRLLNRGGERKVEAEYFYWKEDGSLAFKKVRYRLPDGGKTFTVHTYDYENEKWVSGKGGAEDVIYNLGDVLSADTVLVAEGEKCADALIKYGYVATTSPHGAGSWKPEFSKWLEGKTVYLFPDNDTTGIEHMKEVATSLNGKAEALYWVDLSTHVGEKGDIADLIEEWEEAGLSEEEIKTKINELLKEAEPYDPDRFSILRELSLTPDRLEGYEPEFLIEGFIPKGSLTLITAKYGGGKSLSALAIAKLLISRGERVLYLDLDNSLHVIKERLRQAQLFPYLGRELTYVSRSVHPVHSKSEVWKALKKELRNRDHMVIVVDTLKNFSKGMELNSDKEMTEVMSELMDLRETGHTVLILHHLPKKVDEDEPYKNNTTVVDAVDVAYRLHKNENRFTFENFKDRIPVKRNVAFKIDENLNLHEVLPPKKEEEKIIAEVIYKLIPPEGRKQGDLIAVANDYLKTHVDDVPHGKNRIKEVLEKYEGKCWEAVRLEKNAKVYKRLSDPSTLFSCLPPYIYKEENRQTQEPQRLDGNSAESTVGKLNGDKEKSEIDLSELLKEAEETSRGNGGGSVSTEDLDF